MELDGVAAAGFGPVADAFAGNFEALGEVGAAVAVYHRGRLVVDLAGGIDPIRDRPFRRETFMMVASCTKGATATSVVMLAEAGAIDLDEPIARRWPEFGQAGKGEITVRQVLSHQAGLPYPDPDAPLSGLERIAGPALLRQLERQAPWWTPGTAFAYHPTTGGAILGEVVRRATGRTLGAWFAEHVARPLGLDFWIGLPPELDDRVAPSVWPGGRDALAEEASAPAPPPGTYAARRRAAIATLPPMDPDPHDAASRRAYYGLEVPSASASGTPARSRGCTPRCSTRSTASGCCRPPRSPRPRRRRPTACRRSSRAEPPAPTSASASATSSARPACPASARRRSATPAPAVA